MNTHGEYVDERAVGGDRPVRRPRSAMVVAGAVALVVGLLGAVLVGSVASPAFAEGTGTGTRGGAQQTLAGSGVDGGGSALSGPATLADADSAQQAPAATTTPTPTPVPQNHLSPSPGAPTTAPIGRPVAPTIADPGDITSSTVRFSGSATPGHTVRVSGPGATGPTRCSVVATGAGSWSCLASVASGPAQVFTVADRDAPEVGTARTPASDVVVPPVVTTTRPTNGPVSGTGQPGSTVTLSVSGSTTERTATVDRGGRWTATLGGSRGGDARLSVTATQTASTAAGYRSDLRSAASAPVTITLDSTPPAAPRITAPRPDDRVRTQPATVVGTGEPRAVLTVYVDRAPVCRVDVPASGRWSCTTTGATLAPGVRAVSASQYDAAGNFSRSSAQVEVVVTSASLAPSGTTTTGAGSATPTGPTGTAGGTPGGHDTTGGHGSTGGSATDGTGGPSSAAGGSGGSGTGGSAGSDGAPGSWGGTGAGGPRGLDWSGPAGDWTASTAYDATVPTIQAAFSWRTVLVATAVAAGFLVLVAGPLALVAGTARGRLRNPFAGVLGRNRPRAERRHGDDLLPTWASITVAVLVVGLCTVLGVGVSLEARYVRLAIAVLLGAAVLATTVVLASRWAAGADRRTIGFRVSPWLVLAALVACGVTRALDLSPAVIVGAVLLPVGRPQVDTAALRLGSSIAAGARSATWRSVALLVVAAVGWVLHSVTPGSGFWGSIVSEFAITLCVGGLGAVVTTMLPVAASAGQSLRAQSRGRYAAIAAVAVALTAAVYSGTAGTHVSPVVLGIAAATCAAVAVATRVWLHRARSERTT